MATNTTSHHLTPPPSTIGLMNSSERVRDELTPPTSSRQRGPPSPRTQSKSILTIALQKAQTAVQFDAANNVVAALDAYKQTVELLSQVIDKAANEADRRRLQLIHDTYADRIRLLSTIVPESDSSSDNNEDSERNNDDTSTQNSADSSVNVDSRTNSIERRSLSEYDSQKDLDKTSMIQDIESNSVEQVPSLTKQNVDTKIDNLRSETTLINDIVHNDDPVREKIRNDIADYMTSRQNRLSVLSKRSSTSTSTSISTSKSTKSNVSDKTTPVSIYEISVDGIKSIADSEESTPRSSDLDSEDSNTLNENSDANSENIEENLNYQNQASSSSQQNQEVGKPQREKISINTSQLSPSLKTGSPGGNRVFVPPPPPKIAPPKTPPITPPVPNVLTGRPTSPTIVPPPPAISTIKQSDPPTSPHESSPSRTLSDEDDDKASVKSAPTQSSSSPPPQSPVEKFFGKALPHGRRPAPLPLTQYNSRNIPARSPSNPNIIVTPNSSVTTPRRTASNPGNTHKKGNSIRFFNANSQQISTTQVSPSPWMSSFSVISPPLGSPGLGPPTGTFRSETSSSTSRANDANYVACLLNPFSNTSFFDDDIDFPHMSSNNGLPEPPPSDIRLKPFWLMKLLERTMTSGGYLSPKLFIPQHLWLQGHVKLTALDAKISSCEVVSSCLAKLEKAQFSDLDKLAKELEGIDPILEGLQNSLARKLNYVESTNGKSRQSASSLMSWGSKLSRGLDRMGMGNAMVRTEEASGYIEVLIKVFQRAGVVEKYIKNYTSLKKAPQHHHHKQIIVRLYKFSDFFGNVICRFVLRDLGILTDKYLKKGSHWIVE